MAQLPRVCVIGAGSSGIAVVKALKDRGLPHTCFEKGLKGRHGERRARRLGQALPVPARAATDAR